jgi:hypothetical protein
LPNDNEKQADKYKYRSVVRNIWLLFLPFLNVGSTNCAQNLFNSINEPAIVRAIARKFETALKPSPWMKGRKGIRNNDGVIPK